MDRFGTLRVSRLDFVQDLFAACEDLLNEIGKMTVIVPQFF